MYLAGFRRYENSSQHLGIFATPRLLSRNHGQRPPSSGSNIRCAIPSKVSFLDRSDSDRGGWRGSSRAFGSLGKQPIHRLKDERSKVVMQYDKPNKEHKPHFGFLVH